MFNNDIDLYNNENHIRVYWEDTADNYSKSSEKKIEKYFQDKYKTTKVKVVFKAILNTKSNVSVEAKADASELILDDVYQKKLIDTYLSDNKIEINKAYLDKLDATVTSDLGEYKDQTNRYKSFKILKIEFSNFLSYGENNVIEIGEPGITAITSNPGNFGGKTTLTQDLLSFLFFGVTSKSDKYEDIFNKYTDKDLVVVKGTIEIEGDIYIIKRVLTRKHTKNKGYKCEADLDFYRLLPKGGIQQLNGEERRYTDAMIKNYVGSYEDFFITILTTGDNLDDLIKTKPTERGRLLTRFIGLEYYREKEKIAKKLYSEWKEKSNLSRTTVAEVTTKIDVENDRIIQNQNMNESAQKMLKSVENSINSYDRLKDELTRKRINNVDTELYKINEDVILEGISKLENNIVEKNNILAKLSNDIKEPKEVFDIDRYQSLSTKCRGLENDVLSKNFEIKNSINNINLLKDGEICQTCSRPLDGVDNTEKIKTLEASILKTQTEIDTLSKEILDIKERLCNLDSLKNKWDEFNKNELVISRHKIDLNAIKESLKRGQDKLKAYRDNIKNIEENRRIDTEINVINIKLSNTNNERDSLMLQIKSVDKDIEMSKKMIDGYNDLIKQLNKDEIFDKIYRTYIEIYGKNGISKMILSTMIPLINSYLRMLLIDTAEFVLELRMDEKGDVNFWMVDTVNDVEKPLSSGSGYEKTVSSLALRCVLRKVCSLPKPNIIIFDEITGKVANENLDKLGMFFDKIKTYFENVWLISHNPSVQEWADNTINIVKENQISRILDVKK